MFGVERVCGHSFFCQALGEQPVVVDLGANVGTFADVMSKHFNARVWAVEANPDVFHSIPGNEVIRKFNFAASDTNGVQPFYLSENTEASSLRKGSNGLTRLIEVPTKRLDTFLIEALVPSIDLLKMDIEGAEIAVLRDCSEEVLRGIKQVTVEFHDFCGLVTKREVDDCIMRLRRLGFDHISWSRTSHGHGDVLFVNRHKASISAMQFVLAKTIGRWGMGAGRVLQRALRNVYRSLANG